MTTPLEAYRYTLTQILELKKLGISVVANYSKLANQMEFDKRGVSSDIWIRVCFEAVTPEQADLIQDTKQKLYEHGISFDSGFSKNFLMWDIDWSFSYRRGAQYWAPTKKRKEIDFLLEALLETP